MTDMSAHDKAQIRIARSMRRLAVLDAREIERKTRDRRRRRHGPRPAEVLALLRDFKQQLAGVLQHEASATIGGADTHRRRMAINSRA